MPEFCDVALPVPLDTIFTYRAGSFAPVRGSRVLVPFRNLRHTGATLALQEGTNPVLVAFRLGHASTAMIERHYGELGEGFDAEIADRLAAARKRSRSGPDVVPVSSLAAAQRSRKRGRKRGG